MFFTLMLYVWSSETILFPGEKQGENKKDFILRAYNEIIDQKFPNTPLLNWVQALIGGLLSKLIEALVVKMKANNSDMEGLKKQIGEFFS
jgi:hypothetical protein